MKDKRTLTPKQRQTLMDTIGILILTLSDQEPNLQLIGVAEANLMGLRKLFYPQGTELIRSARRQVKERVLGKRKRKIGFQVDVFNVEQNELVRASQQGDLVEVPINQGES